MINIRGTEYPSAQAVADAFGMNRRAVAEMVREGRQDKIGLRKLAIEKVANAFPMTIRRKRFETIEDCAAHFKISVMSIKQAIHKGRAQYIGLPAHKTRKRHGVDPMPVRVAGKEYENAKAAAAALGVSEITVRTAIGSGREDYVGKGRDRAHAIRVKPAKSKTWKSVKVGPHEWPSICHFARDTGLHPQTIRDRLRRNDQAWLTAKAMTVIAKQEQAKRAERMKAAS